VRTKIKELQKRREDNSKEGSNTGQATLMNIQACDVLHDLRLGWAATVHKPPLEKSTGDHGGHGYPCLWGVKIILDETATGLSDSQAGVP
jgi:hypothetical protein